MGFSFFYDMRGGCQEKNINIGQFCKSLDYLSGDVLLAVCFLHPMPTSRGVTWNYEEGYEETVCRISIFYLADIEAQAKITNQAALTKNKTTILNNQLKKEKTSLTQKGNKMAAAPMELAGKRVE